MVNAVLLFLNIGTPELILIMFVALMLFGGEKLPGLARGLGKGIRDFKDASDSVKREINNQIYNYEEKNTEPAKPEENEPAKLEDHHTEDKPLLDYTPIEGTMAVGSNSATETDDAHAHLATEAEHAEPAHHAIAVEHTEPHNAAASDKPAQE